MSANDGILSKAGNLSFYSSLFFFNVKIYLAKNRPQQFQVITAGDIILCLSLFYKFCLL